MRTILILLALAAMPCAAGQVYKCKGPKGEVTFTNIRCPDNAAVQWTGTYQPASDDPRQYREAIADHNAREEAAQQQQSMANAYTPPVVQGSSSPDNSKRDAEYRETRKRWGARMAGPPPDGYVKAPAAAAPIVSAGIPKPVATQTCSPTAGGNVTCFGSDGTIANGHVNENGSGTMFNSNGAIQQIHSMPKRAGTCVPDVNGNCN